jgi:hypothetical protein
MANIVVGCIHETSRRARGDWDIVAFGRRDLLTMIGTKEVQKYKRSNQKAKQ